MRASELEALEEASSERGHLPSAAENLTVSILETSCQASSEADLPSPHKRSPGR